MLQPTVNLLLESSCILHTTVVWVKVGILYADHVTVYFISQLKMNRNATEFSLLSYCNPVLWHNIIYCFSFGKKGGII